MQIQYICGIKKFALQSALWYHIALLSPARFSEFEGQHFLFANAFSEKNFQQEENFLTGKNLGWEVTPLPYLSQSMALILLDQK